MSGKEPFGIRGLFTRSLVFCAYMLFFRILLTVLAGVYAALTLGDSLAHMAAVTFASAAALAWLCAVSYVFGRIFPRRVSAGMSPRGYGKITIACFVLLFSSAYLSAMRIGFFGFVSLPASCGASLYVYLLDKLPWMSGEIMNYAAEPLLMLLCEAAYYTFFSLGLSHKREPRREKKRDNPMSKTVIVNCRIFDGKKYLNGFFDVVLNGTAIEKITGAGEAATADSFVINAGGKILSPGFTDIHSHLHNLCAIGVRPESAYIPFGVTAAADAGSAGAYTLENGLALLAAERLKTRIFLNVSSAGLSTLRSAPEDIDPEHFDTGRIKELFEKYGAILAGLKIRIGTECCRGMGLRPLAAAAELAHSLGVRLMVHPTDPPAPMAEVLSYLEKGDILSHTYHGRGHTIISDGHVIPQAFEARRRGVIFDVADAGVHLSMDVFRSAAADGFFPDTISGDLTDRGIFRESAYSLSSVLAKLIALGMDEEKALAAVTSVPSGLLGLGDGRIAENARADLVIFDKDNGGYVFTDCYGGSQSGGLIHVYATFIDGELAFKAMQNKDR